MSYKALPSLLVLYSQYLYRQVLNFGIFKSRTVKKISLCVLLVAMGLLVWMWKNFFTFMIQTDENFLLVLHSVSINTLNWSMILFASIKILFMKAGDLIQFTYQLPVSNRLRNLSLVVYENFIVLTFFFA